MTNLTPKLSEKAFIGLPKAFIEAVLPYTEADSAALLIQYLVCFGSAVGRSGHFSAESTKHYPNLFAIVVGNSSHARKGSSFNQVINIFREADPEWQQKCIAKGLSSGEGLIYSIRDYDPQDPKDLPFNRITDEDKRRLVFESELASLLKVIRREGNTLSAVLRDCWDGSKISTMTKSSPMKATDHHISLIGHITLEELTLLISASDITNGLGNRFLYFYSERSKLLPNAEPIPPDIIKLLSIELKDALSWAKKQGDLPFSEAAKTYWNDLYVRLNDKCSEKIVDKLSSRGPAQIRRIALIYSLLNKNKEIDVASLQAGEAIWTYNQDTIRLIFGDRYPDLVMNKIIDVLRDHPQGISKTNLSKALSNNYNLSDRLTLLERRQEIVIERRATAGKPEIIIKLRNIAT